MIKIENIDIDRFLNLNQPFDLLNILNTSFISLENQLLNPIYHSFSIPKKKGGNRSITAPNEELKQIQRKLNTYLQQVYLQNKPDNVFGFVKNDTREKNKLPIVKNAELHVKKDRVLNIDLSNFFSSITENQILTLFKNEPFQFPERIAQLLTRLTTHEGVLPTGAPTSPVLSNFIFIPFDIKLTDYCFEKGISFSRYADDITFSSDTEIPDSFLDEIQAILFPFDINPKKTRIKSFSKKQLVTGLVVNQKVNIDRKMIKKVRAMIHSALVFDIKKASFQHFGIENKEQAFVNKLQGYIQFFGQVRGVEDSIYNKFKNDFLLIQSKFANYEKK
jgi:RNA-directed DNA polymerase